MSSYLSQPHPTMLQEPTFIRHEVQTPSPSPLHCLGTLTRVFSKRTISTSISNPKPLGLWKATSPCSSDKGQYLILQCGGSAKSMSSNPQTLNSPIFPSQKGCKKHPNLGMTVVMMMIKISLL